MKEHIDALSPVERDAFNKGAQITPEELMEKIRGFDELHCRESQFRRCTSGIETFLKTLDLYLKPLSICIGHSPAISSLVVGGVKLIVDVRLSVPFRPRCETTLLIGWNRVADRAAVRVLFQQIDGDDGASYWAFGISHPIR